MEQSGFNFAQCMQNKRTTTLFFRYPGFTRLLENSQFYFVVNSILSAVEPKVDPRQFTRWLTTDIASATGSDIQKDKKEIVVFVDVVG